MQAHKGLGPSPLETSQVFVPGHIRLHTQGRVNGCISHIRALAEGGRACWPGAEAKDFCKGMCFTESAP